MDPEHSSDTFRNDAFHPRTLAFLALSCENDYASDVCAKHRGYVKAIRIRDGQKVQCLTLTFRIYSDLEEILSRVFIQSKSSDSATSNAQNALHLIDSYNDHEVLLEALTIQL